MVESTREIGEKTEFETRFYITSLLLLAAQVGPVVRSHWAVENSLHWVMDMVFRDDECRIRTDHAPANFTTIKHMALNLTRRAPGKDSLRLESMQNRGVIRLLLAVLGHHSRAGSPDSVAGKRPQVCRSARPCVRPGRAAPSLCSSAFAVPCSCAWPRSH